MSPISIQPLISNSIEEEKWQRFMEMQEQYRVMSGPRAPLGKRFMRASGEALIAIGRRLEQSAGIPMVKDLEQAKA